MTFNSTATLLTVAGLGFLLAALTGAILWTDGNPRGQIKSKGLRLLFGLVGVFFVGFAAWQENQIATLARTAKPDDQIPALKQKVADLEVRLKTVQTDVQFAQELGQQVAADFRTSGIRAALTSLPAAQNPYCAKNAGKPLDWSISEDSPCALAINSYWPVQVVVPIVNGREKFRARFEELRVPVTLADISSVHAGLTAEGLGMVFPPGTPLALICAIRDRFVAETGYDLAAIAETADYWRQTRQPVATNLILVGVEFGTRFPDSYKKYRAVTKDDWRQICRETQDQLAANVKQRFKVLERPQVVSPESGSK